MAISRFTHALLGRDEVNPTHDTDEPSELDLIGAEMSHSRTSRRLTSHYNKFQTSCSPATDPPPKYAVVSKQRPLSQRNSNGEKDKLPNYSCTVAAEGRVLVYLESINPLKGVSETEWREAYMVLRGTLLSLHRPKGNGPGKLLRSYTLQHAEVGLAPDSQHAVLIPQKKLAHLIPHSARRKAWEKKKSLFAPVQQYILRLRAELDQILLANSSEDSIHSLIHAIGAAIDISPALDERNIPKQCTVPRRRRRPRLQTNTDLVDPILVANQEQMLRDMYPAFAERCQGEQGASQTQSGAQEPTNELLQTPTREEDEIDLSAIREDSNFMATHSFQHDRLNVRPLISRHTSDLSQQSTFYSDMMYATSSNNFDESGKWRPPHRRTPEQTQRYIKRCMPVLLADAPRPNDIVMCQGRRVKINWRMGLLRDWELQPPSYRSHDFTRGLRSERWRSALQNSSSTVPAGGRPRVRDSMLSNASSARARDSMFSNVSSTRNRDSVLSTGSSSGRNSILSNESAYTRDSMLIDDYSVDEILQAQAALRNLDVTKMSTIAVEKAMHRMSMLQSPVLKGSKSEHSSHYDPQTNSMAFCF